MENVSQWRMKKYYEKMENGDVSQMIIRRENEEWSQIAENFNGEQSLIAESFNVECNRLQG